jgi:tape measure domain-containing protein
MAAPQLRLEVSLNLAGFRNEVRKLTQIAQSEFNPLLKVNVDTKDYRAQLKALERIKPVIKIEDSQLDAARARIGTLNKSLATLRRATSTPIEIKLKYTEIGKPPSAAAGQIGSAVSGRVRADQAVAVLNQKQAIAARNMLKAADVPVSGLGKSRSLEAYRKSIIDGMTNAGKESIAGLTQALKDGQSAIGQAAKIVGQEGIRAIKDTLGIASPSREFKKIGEAAGQGFEQGLLSSMADAFDSLERQLGTKLQRLKAQAIAGTSGALTVSGRVSPVQVADVTPRDYARIAGSGSRAALPPGVDRSAETLQNFYRSLDQIGIALASTVDSTERAADAFKTLRNAIDSLINRAKVLTGEQSLQARLRPSSVLGGMPLLTGRAPSRALPMLSAAAQRPERFTSQEKLFKDFLGRTIKAVVPESGSAAIGRSLFGGTQFREIGNAMRRPQLGAGIDTKVETVAVKDLTIASRNIAAATNALKAQKLLPAAGGTSASQMIRQALSGLPPLKAPQIGAQNISPRGSLGQFPMAGMMAPSSPLGSMGQFPMSGMMGRGSLGQFPMSGMAYPSSPLGRITPQSSMFAGGGGGSPGGGGPGGGGPGGGGGGPLGGMRLNVPQLPGSGVVRELGEEFGFAAKQVLLFGTAYKALAFLQSFPGQVGEAVGALQSFRNTLKTVTPSAAEFDKSSKFILSLVDQYNVPLQSARDGFAKLYASMKPAGFSGAEIRGLFEGVSMGAATFGMSADKVDRVMYAFAQMASKGQVMSEELKGQLGDVLPGALSLFARAADMSVQEFGQAMEDGAFKGEAMRQLLVNVGATMKEEFGKGAVGAAVTYQGVMNRLQTTTVLFYEAFEPAAVAFANTFILPITNGIRIVTDAFAQLLTGQKAITQGGSELAARMQPLIPIFQGIGNNLRQVATAAFNTVKALLPVVQFLLQLAASPVIGFLAQMYASLLLLNGAFTLLGGRLLIGVIASLAQTAIRMTALNAATVITNGSLAGTQLQLRMLSAGFAQTGAAATGFAMTMRTAMMTTVVGAIVAAVAIGIAEFMRLRGVMASIEGRYKSLGDQARLMGEAGNVSGVQKITTQVKEQAQTYEDLAKALNRAEKAGGFLKLDQKGRELLKRTGQSGFDAGTGIITNEDANKIKDAINRNREETKNLLGGVLPGQESKARAEAAKLDAKLEKQKIDLSAGDGTGKPPKEQNLESYYSLQNQLADANTQAEIERIEAQFEHARAMVNAEYDLREARANSFQKKAIAFQREIFAITADRDAALLKSRNKILAESGKVAGGAGGMGGGTAGAYLQGNIGPTSTGPHFDVKKMGGGYFPRNYLDQYVQVNGKPLSSGTTVPGGTFAAHQRRNSHGWDYAFGGGRQAATLTGGAEWMGGAPTAHGEARKFKLPTGEEFQFLHGKSEGIGERAGAPRPVAGSERKRTVAEAKTQLSMNEMRAAAIEKEAEATKGLEIATAKYVQSIVPTSEQQLQNQLLAQRIDLTRNSFSPEILEAQLAFAEQQIEATENIKLNEEAIKTLTAAQGDNSKQINALTDANNQLKANLPVSAIQLYSKAINEQVLSLAQRNKTAMQDAADQEKVNGLIIGGMTRQAAEAKVTAENLRGNYKKALEEATRQVEIAAAAEEVLAAARRLGGKETEAQAAKYNALAQALKDAKKAKEDLEGQAPGVEGAATGTEAAAVPKTASSYIADGMSAAQEKLAELTNAGYQVVQAANAIGDAFGTAFKGLVSGSMTAQEALAGMFQSIADHFADMVAQMIAEYLKMALIKGIMSIIGGAVGGGFTPLSNEQATSFNLNPGAMTGGTPWAFANGGIAPGGFTAFANGGMVTGPTMGLVGEGRYNEAIVPLPDGKSIPVDLGGATGSQITSNIVVNVSSDGKTSSSGSGSDSAGLGRKLEGAVKQVIVDELRPGGLLAGRR